MRLIACLRRALPALLVVGIALSACQPAPAVPSLPVAKPAPAGEFRIALTNADGSAVRWNPCQPIRYVVNLQDAPPFAVVEAQRAAAVIEAASGLDLVYAGTTTERPLRRSYTDVARYGVGWSPILISFATATEFPFGSSTASGYGQAVPTTDPATGKRQYFTGQVVLRPGGWTEGGSSRNPLSLMLRHELGHVLGLAHVGLTTEIMGTGGNGTARDWGVGDKQGLAKIGRPAGCLPVL